MVIERVCDRKSILLYVSNCLIKYTLNKYMIFKYGIIWCLYKVVKRIAELEGLHLALPWGCYKVGMYSGKHIACICVLDACHASHVCGIIIKVGIMASS